jgi:hypothetical protein
MQPTNVRPNPPTRRLTLQKETLRRLSRAQLRLAAGGGRAAVAPRSLRVWAPEIHSGL